MTHVNSIEDILNELEKIQYGWLDVDGELHHEIDKYFKKKYILQTADQVLENKVGIDFDIVEVERPIFKSLGKKFSTYCMLYYESKKIYAHTFLVYEENEKFYWFEYAWTKEKGLHEYFSLYEVLTDIREKFKEHNKIKFMDYDYLCVYKYKKPKGNLNLKDFYKHCENGENVII